MNAITTTERGALALSEGELLDVMESSLYPGAQRQSVKLALSYCRARNLDPMQKPVHLVPMRCKKPGSRSEYEWRDVPMPGVGLYRIQAARTGQHVGTDEPVYGPMVELRVGDYVMHYPEWCRVTVYKLVDGQPRAFTATEFWLENYATASSDTAMPNAMWKKRARGQIAKCAEAQALRKGFPDEVGNQPTADEMEGKSFDFDLQANGDVQPADAAATPAPTPTAAAALQPYPQERFDANLPEWTTVIQSGRHTADRMIAMLSTKGVLSDAQVKTLRDLEVIDNPIGGDPAAAATQEPQQ